MSNTQLTLRAPVYAALALVAGLAGCAAPDAVAISRSNGELGICIREKHGVAKAEIRNETANKSYDITGIFTGTDMRSPFSENPSNFSAFSIGKKNYVSFPFTPKYLPKEHDYSFTLKDTHGKTLTTRTATTRPASRPFNYQHRR